MTSFLVFRGTSDGSGAVALPDGRIATVDDEENPHIRLWSRDGGDALATLAIPELGENDAEPDFEGGTTAGDLTLWIGSHGRDSKGRPRPERAVLLAVPTAALLRGAIVRHEVRVVRHLAAPLRAWGEAHGLGFDRAFGPDGARVPALAPERGGVNVEGMAFHPPTGDLLLGFRSPVPGRRAVIAPLRNPAAVLEGDPPDLGPPLRPDLGGRGIRDMAWCDRPDTLLLLAGPSGSEGDFHLVRWTPGDAAAPAAIPWPVPLPPDFHPEGLIALPGTEEVLVLGDDGDRIVSRDPADALDGALRNGTVTSKRARPDLRAFRGLRVSLATALLLVATPAGAAERRCGWFENPTPANYYLVDRAGRWVLSEMGRHEAEGMDDLPDYAARGWVGDDPRGYGHGCACVVMEADPATRRVTRVVRLEPLPLARCRADRALPPPMSRGRR